MRAARVRVLAAGVTLALLAGATACASGGAAAGTRSHDRNRISGDELRASMATNLYDAIHALRPQWLVKRGSRSLTPEMEGDIVVYQEITRLGGPEILRGITVSDVQEAQFLSPGEATMRFGTGHPHGAIVIVMRSR
jgi:hypothetical protein